MTRAPDASASVARLRSQVEALLRKGRLHSEVEPLLERLSQLAAEGSDDACFAHRHLAELCIERAPWRAALYLRRIVAAHQEDDVVHALMGLCQALLGNYRMAVSSYRLALQASPKNPWYHHNLGHLLDVALHDPARALAHLRAAHRLEPLEDEIAASLAHCLAGLGHVGEARAVIEEALRSAPRNKDHRALLRWIEDGAPEGRGPHADAARSGSARSPSTPAAEPPATPPVAAEPADRASTREVVAMLEQRMGESGFSRAQIDRARRLFRDFEELHQARRAGAVRPRAGKPEVLAAAVEYAIGVACGIGGVTQGTVAKRYGVAVAALGGRWAQIRDVLDVTPNDPRYASR